jgi:hypothetical protein
MAVGKIETDIITSITASMIGQAVIMYVKIFKTAGICNVRMRFDITLTDNIQYLDQFIETY